MIQDWPKDSGLPVAVRQLPAARGCNHMRVVTGSGLSSGAGASPAQRRGGGEDVALRPRLSSGVPYRWFGMGGADHQASTRLAQPYLAE